MIPTISTLLSTLRSCINTLSLLSILSTICISAISLDTFISIPASHLMNVNANSTHSSCYSPHNQLYMGDLEIENLQADIVRDSDFTISFYFNATIGFQRYLLTYNDIWNDILFGLYVTPDDSMAGIVYNTCPGEKKKITLPNEHIRINTELFFALSVSRLNSTHTILSYMVGNDRSVEFITFSGSFKCAFPPEGKFVLKREILEESAVRFIGKCRDFVIAGRSLTIGELELVRQGSELIEGYTPTHCICPKGSLPESNEYCYDSQSDFRVLRLSLDSPRPELATDGNANTYWESAPYDDLVSFSLSFSSPLIRVDLIRIGFVSPPGILTLSVTSSDNRTVSVAQIVPDCNEHTLTSNQCVSSPNSTELIPCCVTAESLGLNSTFYVLFSNSAHLRNTTSISLLFSQLSSPSTSYSISEIELYSQTPQNTTDEMSPTVTPSITSSFNSISTTAFLDSSQPLSSIYIHGTPTDSLLPTPSLVSSQTFPLIDTISSFGITPTLSPTPSPIQSETEIRLTSTLTSQPTSPPTSIPLAQPNPPTSIPLPISTSLLTPRPNLHTSTPISQINLPRSTHISSSNTFLSTITPAAPIVSSHLLTTSSIFSYIDNTASNLLLPSTASSLSMFQPLTSTPILSQIKFPTFSSISSSTYQLPVITPLAPNSSSYFSVISSTFSTVSSLSLLSSTPSPTLSPTLSATLSPTLSDTSSPTLSPTPSPTPTPTDPPTPTAPPTPQVIPPCTLPISPIHINITVPNSLGYKQLNFSTSTDVTDISFLPTNSLSEMDAQLQVAIPFGLSKRFIIESLKLPISKLDYFIHSSSIWDLDPYLNLSIVALDADNSFNIQDTDITINITLDSDSVALVVSLSEQSFTKLVTLTLPPSWFSPPQPDRVTLFTVTSPTSLLIHTTLSLHLITTPNPDVSVPTDTRPVVIVTLPHYPLYSDSIAVLSVHLLADIAVRYFVMRLNYPLNSKIINLDSSLQWEFSNSSNTVAISGFVNLPRQGMTSHKLFGINLVLFGDDTDISCELSQVFDEHFNPLVAGDSSSLCYFSGPSGLSSSTGILDLLSESVTHIAAYPQQPILYNHAVLSRSAVRTPVYTYLYTSRGVKRYGTGQELNCTSSREDVVKIDSSCSNLYFNGSELYGSDNISVGVHYRDLTTEVNLKVFYPNIPITLSLSDTILNSIPSYPGTASCDSTFQTSRILAYTDFTTPSESVRNVDVLSLVIDFVFISDTSLARIRDGMYLAGVSVGSGSIRLTDSDGRLSETQFTVSNDPVEIACYSPHVYSDVEINSNSLSLTTTTHKSQSLEFSFPQRFLYNSTRGFTSVLLRYSDSNIELFNSFDLVASNGVSTGENTFILSNDTALTFSLPTTCPLLKSLSFITPIRLQQPDDVIVTLSNQILTIEGPATTLGYQTYANLSVHLVYGSERILVTNPLVSISIQNTNILELMYTQDGAVLRTKGMGTTDVTVSLSQFSVTKQISIQIASIKMNLQSKLFISHSNSTRGVSLLSRVSPKVFQSGDLVVEAVLTNSQVVPIPADSTDLVLVVREGMGLSDAPDPVTDKAYFLNNRLYVNSSLVAFDTNLRIFASYLGSSTKYPILLSTNTLSVVNLTSFDTIPDLNGVIGNQFMVNFGLALSDGTFFPKYFQEGAIFPGLVNFDLSDPRSIFFDPSTGMLTLIGNSKDLVAVRAKVGNSTVVSNGFAANLVPVGNNIDIGSEEGLALPHRPVNDRFTIPIWLQAEVNFKSVDISLEYNSDSLSINSITPDASFKGGLFLSNSESGGMIRFGGVTPLPLSGARLLVAEIELSSSQPQEVNLIATVNSLSGPFPLYANILTENNIRLTNLTQVVTTSRSIRSSDESPLDRVRERRSQVCVSMETIASGRRVCVECAAEVKGDVNRDCRFDLNDVSYLLDYVSASYTGFSSNSGRLIREEFEQLPLSRIDINEDGKVSISDVNYLNWVNFRLSYFLQSVQAELNFPDQTQANDYDCELSVFANLMEAPLTADRFYVYFEVSQTSSLSDQFLNQENPIQGAFVANTSREQVSSRIYQTDGFAFRYIIPGSFSQNIGISPILVATDGNQFQYQTLTNRSSTLGYPELRVIIPFPQQNSDISVYIPGGYSPYFTYKPPTFCGAPAVSLELIGEIQAEELRLYWPGTGGKGPFNLKKVFCSMIGRESNFNLPCAGVIMNYQNISFPEYSATNLNSYSVYHFRMEVGSKASRWTQFMTLEAAPESLLPPSLLRYNISCIYIRWKEPEKPNGVILNYTLFLNDTITQVAGVIRSYLLCGVSTEGVHDVNIQASNSAGNVRSEIIQATLETTVNAVRVDSHCVELNWTQLTYNATQESFIISIDNVTIAVTYEETRIIVCDLITDGTPFYLEITSSRVGKLFSGSLLLPFFASYPIYIIILAVLLPIILIAILLLICCVVLGCWRRFMRDHRKITVVKPVDFWSTEEEFVEVSPTDQLSLEQVLQIQPAGTGQSLSGRDRSSTFESSDSWMAKDPALDDAERGEAYFHATKHDDSFNSESFCVSDDKHSDTSYNNVTMTSEDRAVSHITPRKAYSFKGRDRLSGTASDLRKVKMRHSWHNLRHKRFVKRPPSKQLTPSKSASELYQNGDFELTELKNETIITPTTPHPGEDVPPKHDPTQESVALEISTQLSEVYVNPIETGEELAETHFFVQEIEDTPLKQEFSGEVYPNPFTTERNADEIPDTPFSIEEFSEEIILKSASTQEIGEEILKNPFFVQEPTEVISKPIFAGGEVEEINENPFSVQELTEEITSKPLSTQEMEEEVNAASIPSQPPVEELTSTPLPITQEPTVFFPMRFSGQETIEEVVTEPLSTEDSRRDVTSTPLPSGEATILDSDPPKRRALPSRPSLELIDGHVLDMAQGYEVGDLPLEENKPHPMLHERSFTELPKEDSVHSRRSVFQSPGYQLSFLSSDPQSTDLPEKPPTPDADEASDTQNAEFSTE